MKLYPYQKEGVAFLTSRRRAGLFDDIGLGKSAQAAAACKVLKLRRVLIVCPASLILNWKKEWKKFGPSNCRVKIVSYNYIQKTSNCKRLHKLSPLWDAVIADECQNINKWFSAAPRRGKILWTKQTKNFVKLIAPKAKRLYLLSASPATKCAGDYHPILSLLLPGKIGSYRKWKLKHCKKRVIGSGLYKRTDWTGFRRTKEINRLIRSCAIRRLREDVLSQLPGKQFSTFSVSATFEGSLREVKDSLRRGEASESILPALRQLSLDKAAQSIDYLKTFYEKKEPLVIFYWYTDTRKFLEENLPGTCRRISGGVSVKKKQKAVDLFQKGKLDYLLIQIRAGGTGYTVTRARYCFFQDLPWSAADFDQAWGRIYRIGQKRNVNIITCLAENSYDDRQVEILREKAKGMKKTLDR